MANLVIRPLVSAADLTACAELMVSTEPWLTLGQSTAESLRYFQQPNRERYIATLGERLVGFLVLNFQGPFVGYLQAICLAPDCRGRGLGSALVAFAEDRIFRDHPNVFLCVSSFNPGARRLYERLGYAVIGDLPDYLVVGHSETLMRKTRGPLRPATRS